MKKPRNKTITRRTSDDPIRWIVTHPAGHIYSMPSLDSFLNRHSATQEQLEALGWRFQADYLRAIPESEKV